MVGSSREGKIRPDLLWHDLQGKVSRFICQHPFFSLECIGEAGGLGSPCQAGEDREFPQNKGVSAVTWEYSLKFPSWGRLIKDHWLSNYSHQPRKWGRSPPGYGYITWVYQEEQGERTRESFARDGICFLQSPGFIQRRPVCQLTGTVWPQ